MTQDADSRCVNSDPTIFYDPECMHEILRIKSKREAFDQSKQGLFRHAIRTTQHGYAMIFFRGKT